MNYDEPAFPVNFANDTEWDMEDPFGRVIPENSSSQYTGITKRDYFAAKAMQAMIAKSPLFPTTGGNYSENSIAVNAYTQADAMIEESNDER